MGCWLAVITAGHSAAGESVSPSRLSRLTFRSRTMPTWPVSIPASNTAWSGSGPGDSPKELPAIIQEQDESFRRINNPVDMWRGCAMRMTDNFLDIAHFPWVHTGTFGNNQRRSVPEIELEMLEGGYYGYEYKVVADNPPNASLSSGRSSEVVSRHMTTGFHLPFTRAQHHLL